MPFSFPPYIFIPGLNPHPKKEGGYRFEQAEPVAEMIDLAHPEKSEFLQHSLNLYNNGYYWESHVYFEALWNAHSRVGSVADFFKAMIKLGAAGVKLSIHQPDQAKVHLIRAQELFTHVMKDEGPQFLGFDLREIIQNIDLEGKLPFIGPV
jgi:hypothetical protein